MNNLLNILYDIIEFTIKDVVVNVIIVTLLSLVVMAILSGLFYIIYKIIKGKTK